MKNIEVTFHEMRVSDIKWDGPFSGRVYIHPLCHRFILLFVRMNTSGRMQVECSAQALFMQPTDEAVGVGKEFAVPGVTGPAIGGIAGFGDMPVHIDDAHRKRRLI